MPDAAPSATSDDRSYRRWLIGAVAFAAVVRIRYLVQPLAPDEGGYLAIARAWADGGDLYTRFWVDRPQGMMVLFRVGDLFTGPGDGFLRVLAVVLGTSGIVAAGWMGRRLTGRWEGGALAAVFVSLLSCTPAIEGFTANGELLSAAFVAPGMALTLAVVLGRRSRRWLFLAGVLAGLAISIKQSGYDGLIGTCLWFAAAWLLRWRDRKDLVVQFLWLMAGLWTTVGLLFLQGTSFGWSAYWDANVGFRLRSRSALSGAQWDRLGITASITLGLVVGMLAVVVIAARRSDRPLRSLVEPARGLAACWLAGALLALLTGGNYHRHYWITVVFPLGLVLATLTVDLIGGAPADGADAEAGADGVEADGDDAEADAGADGTGLPAGWPLEPKLLGLACVVPLAVTALFMVAPRLEQDRRLDQDRAVAEWVREHGAGTNAILLPVCGSASYHVVAGQTPPYPYLWVDNVIAARDSVSKMEELLADAAHGPAFVARYQPTTACDETGRIEAAIVANFEPAATVDGIEVLRRRGT